MAKKVTRTVEKKKEGGVKSKKVTYKTKSGTTVTRTKSKGGGTGKRKSTTVTNKAGKTVATSDKAKRQYGGSKYGGGVPKRKKKTVTSGNTTVTTRKQSSGADGKQTRRTVKKNGNVVSKKTKRNLRPAERVARDVTTATMLAAAPGSGAFGAGVAAGGVGMNYGMRRGFSGKTKTKNGKVVKKKGRGANNLRFRDVPLPKSNF